MFGALGPPTLASPEAIRLRVFCSAPISGRAGRIGGAAKLRAACREVYALQLQPMYDYEFFGAANPLRLEEVGLDTIPQLGLDCISIAWYLAGAGAAPIPQSSHVSLRHNYARSGLDCR